ADPRARLAIPLEGERRLHQRAGVAVEYVDCDSLAVASVQLRLGIKEVECTRRSLHEQPNHGLCSGSEMWRARGSCTVARRFGRACQRWGIQQVGQSQHTQAAAGSCKELPPGYWPGVASTGLMQISPHR